MENIIPNVECKYSEFYKILYKMIKYFENNNKTLSSSNNDLLPN